MSAQTVWLVEGGEYDDRYIAGAFSDREAAKKFEKIGLYSDTFPVQLDAHAAAIKSGLRIFTIRFNVSENKYQYGGGYYVAEYNPDAPGYLRIYPDTRGEIVLFSRSIDAAIEEAREIVDRAMKKFFSGDGDWLNLRVRADGEIIDHDYREPWW